MAPRKRKLLGWYLILGLLLIFALFPIYWMLVTSLKSFDEVYTVQPVFWPQKLVWENYVSVFTRYEFGTGLANSLIVAVAVSVFSIVLATFSAYAVVRLRFKGRRSMPRLFLFSYLIPQTILFIPIYIFLVRLGFTDTILGIMIVYPTITIPYATWVLVTYFQTLPLELEEAARVDGASRWQTILRVVLPASYPALVSTFIFSFTLCWSEFIYALVIVNSKLNRTITISLSSMMVADVIPWGPLMAGAVLSAVPIMILYTTASRYIVSGLTLGAVKE
jgi:multiple sugar transport system permease protein